jgi:hypothetical protein
MVVVETNTEILANEAVRTVWDPEAVERTVVFPRDTVDNLSRFQSGKDASPRRHEELGSPVFPNRHMYGLQIQADMEDYCTRPYSPLGHVHERSVLKLPSPIYAVLQIPQDIPHPHRY